MSPALLAVLRCPMTMQPLRWADADELAALQAAHAAGRLRTRLHHGEVAAFANCVVCESGEICYPVRDGMPFLLQDEAFTLPDT
jgi:uncharacterized protein YbaR (Trm112 family)